MENNYIITREQAQKYAVDESEKENNDMSFQSGYMTCGHSEV